MNIEDCMTCYMRMRNHTKRKYLKTVSKICTNKNKLLYALTVDCVDSPV